MKKLFLAFLSLFLNCCLDDRRDNANWYVVNVVVDGNGKVSCTPEDGRVLEGDTIELLALPDSGSVFFGWEAGSFTAHNPLRMQVDSSFVITAHFARTPSSMILIESKQTTFLMGSGDPKSPTIEKPVHQVLFTYDFYCNDREVTNDEYYSTIKRAEGLADSSKANLPVTGISWYDAVIYCNQKSQLEGYDTVYTYTARCKSAGGCPYELENLVIHYERFGYRLPTEAEWEFACKGGAATRYPWGEDAASGDAYAWYFKNAENRLHHAGSKLPNGYELYDMSGNAAEWVNDRLSRYADSLYVNPVGPHMQSEEEFMRSGERPIKGGSFRLSDAYLQPSMRKGPYPMTATVTQIDVGFRTVMGSFSPPAGIEAVLRNDSIDVAIVGKKSDLIELLGTSSIKTAFVYNENHRRFCMFADFTASPVTMVKCSDDTTVIAPSMSPDGKFIAWGSRDEGAHTGSMITIRSLEPGFTLLSSFNGFLPRWWVSPDMPDTFLIFTDGASQNNLSEWSNEKTYRIKVSGGKISGSPEVLWSRGSYHDGLSSDGRYLGTAFTVAKLVDLQLNDTNIFYFQTPWNGRSDSAPQVCNFSMSPSRDKPGEALFLDFGYPEVSTIVGRPYDLHSIIFFATTALFSKEHISQWISVPDGYNQWNYTEFTNYSGAVSAIAQTSSENDKDALVLINRKSGKVVPVIKCQSMRDPSVWIDPDELSEADDPYRFFGKYDEPHQTSGQVPLAAKLRLFWHEREKTECVAIGNSPMLYGFDPHSITTLPTINIGWFQGCIGSSITIALQYVLPNAPKLKVLIIDLDASYFNIDSKAKPRLTGLYYTKGYELDSSNNFYRMGVPEAVVQKINHFTDEHWDGFDLSGSFTDSVIGEGWGTPVIEGNDYSLDDSIVKVNIALFRELLDSTSRQKVKVIAINFPQHPGYAETEMVGRAGPKKATYGNLVTLLNTLVSQYPHFTLYDANNYGKHDYSDSEALDANHLNMFGGIKIAERIDSLLQVLLK